MKGRKQYSLDLKNAVISAVDGGLSQGEVARQFNIPYQTVGFWCRNQKARGHVDNQPRSGRPKKKYPFG